MTGIGTADNPLVQPITGERIVFLKRSRDTDGTLLRMQHVMAPHGFVAAPHVHPNQEERFQVGGSPLVFRIGKVERIYQPGETAVVPPGAPHVWWNPGQDEAHVLMEFAPALDTETFFENWFGLAADGKFNAKGLPKSLLQLMVLARDYRREIAFPPPLNWIVGPLAMSLAPVGRLRGYRSRYERYSGRAVADPVPAEPRLRS
jgi:quercetin dioxygenase-like cupin family protein